MFDENDQEVPRGELGELVIRGPSVMPSYWNKPEATAETLRNGWLHTGDLGHVDVDGYLYFQLPAKVKRKHLELSYDGRFGEFVIEFKRPD